MTSMEKQQEHLQNFLQQRQTLLKELETMQNELNLKKEHFLKVQGAIEYLQQCAVSSQPTFSSETPDQKGG